MISRTTLAKFRVVGHCRAVLAALGLIVLAQLAPSLPEPMPCLATPLQLQVFDFAEFATLSEHFAGPQCKGRFREHPLRHRYQPALIGRASLFRTRLLGEEFGFGINTIVRPGDETRGEPDQIVWVPSIDLPDRWDWAIDKATEPLLIVGGAAVVTSIIVSLLR